MRRRRRLWLISLAVPVVLVAAATAYWRIAISNLEQGFANWVAVQQMNGWTVQHSTTKVRSWPFAGSLVIPSMSLRHDGPGMPGAVTWSAEEVTLRVALARPTVLEIA